ARHESLRTVFATIEGVPVQVVLDEVTVPLPVVDGPANSAGIQALAEEEARRPFDLERGPLVRATLIRTASTEHRLLLTLHHIVCDGWSVAIFVREVVA